jgi:hypothetical protein
MQKPRFSRGVEPRLCLGLAIAAALIWIARPREPEPAAASPPAIAGGAASSDCELTLEAARAIATDARENDGASYVEYSGDEEAKILAAVNALPPTSAWLDEIILVIARPGQTKVALAHAGCVDRAFLPPPAAWDELVRQALGERS